MAVVGHVGSLGIPGSRFGHVVENGSLGLKAPWPAGEVIA